MTFLQLAALLDPATPAEVLHTIASTKASGTARYLLVHPNAATADLDGYTIGTPGDLGRALGSPAATPATRARVLAAASTAHGLDEGTSALLAAAARHPAHLRTLAEGAAPFATQGLHQLAAIAERGGDPYTHHLATTRARVQSRYEAAYGPGADEAAAALVRSCPDPVLTGQLLTDLSTSGFLADTVVVQVALIGTDAWYRAWQGRPEAGGRTPAAPSSRDPHIIDALTATDPDIIEATSHQPLTAPAQRLAAIATTLDRATPDPAGDVASAAHAARIAAHPATDPATAARAGTYINDLLTTSSTARGPYGAALQLIADAARAQATWGHTLADAPVHLLNTVARLGALPGEAIAYRCAPLLRSLHPAAQRAALALERTFPGTLGELLATCAAITAP